MIVRIFTFICLEVIWKITILYGILVGNVLLYVFTDFLNTTAPFSRCLYERSPECS